MAEQLFGRQLRLLLSIPVKTPGDFNSVTTDVLEINANTDGIINNIPSLRVQFKITKTLEKEPNTAEITISNLSEARRASLQSKGVKLDLSAGYVSTGVSRLYVGDVRTIDHVRNGTDWETVIKSGDGERSYQFARCQESFAPGTSAGAILSFLADQSGLALGNTSDVVNTLNSRMLDQGYVVSGTVQQALQRFTKSFGLTYSIQNGTLQFLSKDTSLNSEIAEISPATGLIGSPEMGTPEKNGQPALLKFTSLLFPVYPGVRVKLTSKRYNGVVAIRKVEYSGDTMGGDWNVTCQGVIT